MKEKIKRKVTCLFCGKTREYVDVIDDGRDWYGHQRGNTETYTEDNGCDCALGKIEHNKAAIKKMCKNCRFYDGINCINDKKLREVSSFFDCGDKLVVKYPTEKCKHWELDTKIFERLLK